MAVVFSDDEFQLAWIELDEPRLDGWDFFTETMGVKVYRLYHKESGLYEYKAFGSLTGCSSEICADVYMDLNYRKQWDSYVKELDEKDFSGQKVIYWEVKYPTPLSNRDYVYMRERRVLEKDGRKIWVILAKSTSESQCPEKKGVIRVKDYKQTLAIENDGSGGTKVFLNYFDNPGGMIPTWLVNWVAKTGVPAFLTDMKKACSNYSSYCKTNK
ncbi:phosphatidylcholine transfer protein [Paramisgurnus dabryanus]|uniref:phosphatidylcholine transfer protein n=1 Tax=Paramisgurnus dabryanus TaxID=90735 RepID=UPI0031F39FF2